MNIVLINGKARSGKNYFADKLKYSLTAAGRTSEIMEFSDPIKEIISDTLGISIDELNNFKNEPEKISLVVSNNGAYKQLTNFRQLLQQFGTEAMMQQFGKHVWVDLLEKRANKSDSDFIIVPSFRFPHEAISPLTVHIKNDNIVSNDAHASENALNDFEFWETVDNTGYKDLTRATEHMAQMLINLNP